MVRYSPSVYLWSYVYLFSPRRSISTLSVICSMHYFWTLNNNNGDNSMLKYYSHRQTIQRTSSSAERPHELDQRFQMGGRQFEAVIDLGVTFRAIATRRNLRLRII